MYCETSDFNEFRTAEDEVAQLDEEFKSGQLDRLTPSIATFVKAQRKHLSTTSENVSSLKEVLTTLKHQIIQVRSIDSRNEMNDQIKAINDEIWFRGERGEYDRSKIATDWACNHAANWRRWRIKEYLYLVDRRSDLITEIIGNSESYPLVYSDREESA